MVNNKAVIFKKYAVGYPVADEHFEYVTEREVSYDLRDGEVLTRNLFVSLDPYLRARMRGPEETALFGRFPIGEPLDNHAIGEVVASKNPAVPVGSVVVGYLRFEEYTHVPAGHRLTIIEGARESKLPLSVNIGALGMPGFTAYGGLLIHGKPKAGETLYVSAASGAVGQLVGQMAKTLGLRVVGSAGSDEKVAYLLNELKFDAAFNYKNSDILTSLKTAAPEGINIYFDNVGGHHLEAALEWMLPRGRVVICGQIGDYNTANPPGVRNLFVCVPKEISIQGFKVNNFSDELKAQFKKDVSEWLLSGKIIYREDITVGLENAPSAFIGMLKGKNFGKATVKIADL
ncbi:hypothetical protein BGZ99_005208 [Dissophora globulifera]|uniref:Enoyl reductase (ER) domain-containing protein n=1 Tax=Dissophora globulifera TaxID=979702 RepID=A0A9P6UU40_9FUNG|nr:hypothetical protein BGZ99_005208 [Dissophora globulifera]